MASLKSQEKKIQQIQDAFNEQLDGLMADHAGQFVLMAGKDVDGFFPTRESAYTEGIARFGVDKLFLVAEVKTPEDEPTSLSWLTGAMFVEA